jgi:hypothetical protein
MCFISFPFLKGFAVEQKIIYYQSFTSNINSVTLKLSVSLSNKTGKHLILKKNGMMQPTEILVQNNSSTTIQRWSPV